MTDQLDALKRVPLFASLSTPDLETLTRSLRERRYPEGATIVREGEPGLGFFLIADGEVEVSRSGHSVRRLGPGEFFGELALLRDAPRAATVTAVTPTRCLQLVRWDFRALVSAHPDLAVALLGVVSGWLATDESRD